MLVSHGALAATPRPPCALTIGNFDGIHIGHQAVINRLVTEARENGLSPTLLTFEPHPREFFSPTVAPARLTSLREKLELLARCGLDRVHICHFNQHFSRLSSEAFIEQIVYRNLNARKILVGEDFRFGAKRAGDINLLKEQGQRYQFDVETLSDVVLGTARVSSTGVRQALSDGNLKYAAQLLGRPYSISGRVTHGDKLGRELGFPTANILLKHNKPPLGGIFAVELRGLNNAVLRGVASLGVRPTVHANGKTVLEVFIFDFNHEIYRRHLKVTFLHKLRDEAKYPDLETLKKQITVDIELSKLYFQRDHG